MTNQLITLTSLHLRRQQWNSPLPKNRKSPPPLWNEWSSAAFLYTILTRGWRAHSSWPSTIRRSLRPGSTHTLFSARSRLARQQTICLAVRRVSVISRMNLTNSFTRGCLALIWKIRSWKCHSTRYRCRHCTTCLYLIVGLSQEIYARLLRWTTSNTTSGLKTIWTLEATPNGFSSKLSFNRTSLQG